MPDPSRKADTTCQVPFITGAGSKEAKRCASEKLRTTLPQEAKRMSLQMPEAAALAARFGRRVGLDRSMPHLMQCTNHVKDIGSFDSVDRLIKTYPHHDKFGLSKKLMSGSPSLKPA